MALLPILSHGLALLASAGAGTAAVDAPSPEAELPRITVSERARDPLREPAGFAEFDDVPLWQAPVAVDVVTSRDMRAAGARSLSSLVRATPAAADAYNTIGYVETLQVRGFVLDSVLNHRRNGLPVSNYVPFALENKEAISFLKGLNGALAGTSAPGGLVSYVTKRPSSAPIREVNAEVSERGTWSLAVDAGERLGSFGYRINVASEERRPHARGAPGDRRLVAGAVDLHLPREGVAEAEIEWQRARQISVPGFGLLDRDGDGVAETLPEPIDPRINLNDQPWSQPFESRSVVGTARIELAVAGPWRAGLQALAQRTVTHDRIAFPDGCSSGPAYVYPGLCGNYDVDIYDYRSENERRSVRSTEAYAKGRFATGALAHRVHAGARATRYAERLPAAQAYNFVGTINVFAPVELPADPALTVLNTERDLALDELYVHDAVSVGPAWMVRLGARHVNVKARSALTDGNAAVALRDDMVLPWVAVAWTLRESASAYLSWGTGVEAEVVPNRPADFANPGVTLAPGRSRQVEAGYKQLFDDGGSVQVAVFQIRKPYSADVAQPAGPPLRIANARTAQHRGAEVSIVWFADRALALDLRGTYLDARFAESGKRVTNVPKVAASAGVNWRPSERLDLQWRNRIGYAGARAVTADNAVELPSSWQWDTAWLWSPAAQPQLQVRFGIDNVTDRRYWREAPTQPWGGIYLFPAQPRTFRAGLSVQL
jgi:iron complex outermembrane receptor protein